MTSFITDILIKYNFIEESERKTYIYCFSFITEYLLFIATSLIIGALFHNILPLMIFLTVFIILRSFGGGYHACTHTGCILYSYITIILFCILISRVDIALNAHTIYCFTAVYILSCVLYILYAPVDCTTRRLDAKQKHSFKKRAVITCLLTASIYIIFVSHGNSILCISVLSGNVLCTISMLLGRINEQ